MTHEEQEHQKFARREILHVLNAPDFDTADRQLVDQVLRAVKCYLEAEEQAERS